MTRKSDSIRPKIRFGSSGQSKNAQNDPAPLKPPKITEFLHAFALHFGAVDIAFAIDADEVEIVEFAELMADAAVRRHQFSVRAIDHVELAVGVVDHQEIGLGRVRPLYDRA